MIEKTATGNESITIKGLTYTIETINNSIVHNQNIPQGLHKLFHHDKGLKILPT